MRPVLRSQSERVGASHTSPQAGAGLQQHERGVRQERRGRAGRAGRASRATRSRGSTLRLSRAARPGARTADNVPRLRQRTTRAACRTPKAGATQAHGQVFARHTARGGHEQVHYGTADTLNTLDVFGFYFLLFFCVLVIFTTLLKPLRVLSEMGERGSWPPLPPPAGLVLTSQAHTQTVSMLQQHGPEGGSGCATCVRRLPHRAVHQCTNFASRTALCLRRSTLLHA